MAQRRMFNKAIIGSAKFIKMPQSTQALYFHLGMNADDDGVVEAFAVMRMVGCNEDDLKVLSAKGLVIVLNEDLVAFITDWNEHNLIRADRKIDSKYKDLLVQIVKDVKLLKAKTRSDATKEMRKMILSESKLPYSFNYKIRQYFYGKPCPICNRPMERNKLTDVYKPTIQHNIPLSNGGLHELGNISVICQHCNVTTTDRPTGKLNSDEVTKIWYTIGPSNVRPMPAQDSIGKVRIEKKETAAPTEPPLPAGCDIYNSKQKSPLTRACGLFKARSWCFQDKKACQIWGIFNDAVKHLKDLGVDPQKNYGALQNQVKQRMDKDAERLSKWANKMHMGE